MIILRYFAKEIFGALLSVTAVVLLIFLSNQFVRYLGQAAAGEMSFKVVTQLMSIQIPILLGLLLPLGLFLGILIAYGRFYTDNEMTVLSSCGMSEKRLLGITLLVAVLVMFFVAAMTLWVSPRMLEYRDRLMDQAASGALWQSIMPGRFQQAEHGRRVFYVSKVSSDRRHMSDIFMAERVSKKVVKGGGWDVMSADKGYLRTDKQNQRRYFVVTDGHRYLGVPGNKDYRIVKYGSYGLHIKPHTFELGPRDQEAVPTSTLWHKQDKNSRDLAELQWRFSIPLSALLLAVVAVPLSRTQPRQGRYKRLLPALLIYMVYANLLLVSRSWVEDAEIDAHIGMWWVHMLLVLVMVGIWLWPNLKRKRRAKEAAA